MATVGPLYRLSTPGLVIPPLLSLGPDANGLISILGLAPHLRVGFSEDQPPGACCLYLSWSQVSRVMSSNGRHKKFLIILRFSL